MEDVGEAFIKKEILKSKNRSFIVAILTVTIVYFLLTVFLNSIRAHANIVLLWFLIIIQFIFYFSIFVFCYERMKDMGRKTPILYLLVFVLAILGRVNDWEVLIIPLLVLVMIVLSCRNKTVPSFPAQRPG
jgi:uncharacterized membrane protein YhaH (DUF805 family)